MRNPSSCSLSIRPLAAALLLGGAALVISEVAAPAPAHAVSRTATVNGDATGGFGRPGVARRLIRPHRAVRVRPQRRLRPRASRSAVRVRPRVARVIRPLIPLTDPVWGRLRRCESGGRYDINTGNGFYGAYQFVPSTWRGLGFPGMPHQAPPHVQDEAAQKLQARSGWGQWPACTRKLGLR
jgi:resuscitation-promoting factor RpfA